MDLFKFTPSGSSPTTLDQGAQINDYSRVTWVERYNAPGEFTIEAKLSSGLTGFLSLGSLISHVDTGEIMIVENHEVMEEFASDPTIAITGRSFPSYLENRAVGVLDARNKYTFGPYTLTANYTWNQIVTMINAHISSGDDAVDNVVANSSVSGTGESVARTIERGYLWTRVAELLKIDDLGIRTIRRNPFGLTGGSSTETRINIYKGEDKTSTIMFSWITGDISEAQYLFSLKDEKNCALVSGQYIQVMVDGSETKYDRRIMIVDGKDIDGHYGAAPTGGDLTTVVNAMTTLGQQALAAQNQTSITEIELSVTTKPQFRKDYNVGDLVSIDGNFGQIAVRRISEYAEIEDENGKTGHPTLSVPGE